MGIACPEGLAEDRHWSKRHPRRACRKSLALSPTPGAVGPRGRATFGSRLEPKVAYAATFVRARAIRITVVVLAPVERAVSRIPLPLIRACLISAILVSDIGGRPRRFLPRTRLRPATTRDLIIARSNSANTPRSWNIARPDGVLVSSVPLKYGDLRASAFAALMPPNPAPTITTFCSVSGMRDSPELK